MTFPAPAITPAQLLALEIETLCDPRALPVQQVATRRLIEDRLARYTFRDAVPIVDALADVADMLRRWTLHAIHPRYFGLFVPAAHQAGVWGEALAALYNPQLAAWWHAPAANEIEAHVLRQLATVIGYDATVAHFTTGGSEANLTAVLAAITKACPEAPRQGVATLAAAGCVYVSSQAHHSIHKALRVAGLGDAALRVVPCNTSHQLDADALTMELAADAMAGRRALMIVGTVGTTGAGAVDDLERIGAIARASGAWFHVDAAWGGTAAFAPALSHLFRGIDRADSVTWDAHKWLPVPMGAGMFLSRHPDALTDLFSVDAAYLPGETLERPDPYRNSLQWSRRFAGLKVFLTLAVLGAEGVTAMVEHQLDMAEHLRRRLRADGFVLQNDSLLPVVCFTHPALQDAAAVTAVADRLGSSGRAWLSAARLPCGTALRACITHHNTQPADVDALCDELRAALTSVA